ncbi:DUF3152 domain-containing protein [Streptomyces sp. NPDC014986]|uniref:DUF3152 domain-containing protein n=1 Tax=Streptomyces sp. NPDC014986 TaxID=3364934 RepID=UPI0036F72B23
MGRHSRRGPAPKGDTADTTAARGGRAGREGRRGDGRDDRPGAGRDDGPHGTPPHGTPAYGAQRPGTPADGVPRLPDGWLAGAAPAGGVPRMPDGTPAHGFPRLPDGTPAHGVPRMPDGTPAHGVPRLPDGTPAHGVPRARGGLPEQREPGGGWGTSQGRTAAGSGAGHGMPPAGRGVPLPRQRRAPSEGPRQDYLDAFGEEDDLFTPRRPAAARSGDACAAVTERNAAPVTGIPSGPGPGGDKAPPAGEPAPAKGGKGRAFTGVAAAAVTTVLLVVVAGQAAGERGGTGVRAQSAGDPARDVRDSASRGDDRETPSAPAAEPLTYEQKMDKRYPVSASSGGTGEFDAIPGIDKAPGAGQKITYRVDVERGLGLDGELFAEAVQKTLNDDRSWAHNGARAFERIHSGQADFVITLAGPETTAEWCARSGLDTTVDNVSCDSAATERVMINAYRWAQGAETYGGKMHAYRQMLINHEIGHRLGYGHVTCDKDGDLAPVMQQQTKFLEHDGISCRPNPWPYPKS